MKRNIRISLAGVVVAGFLVAGCGSAADQAMNGETVATYKVGNETVAVSEHESLGMLYPTMSQMVSTASSIVEARLVGAQELAAEVQPPSGAEGAIPGLGPDIYGTIDFEVLSVIKGDPAQKNIRIVYRSGKRDGDDKTKRIAYTYDGMVEIQNSNAMMKRAVDLADKRFLVFSKPNGASSQPIPFPGDVSTLAHPDGLALIKKNGQLKFGAKDDAPVSEKDGKFTLSDVRGAVR